MTVFEQCEKADIWRICKVWTWWPQRHFRPRPFQYLKIR